MGVNLTPIAVKRTLVLDDLSGKALAVDAPGDLYQFLALIRRPDGAPLKDSSGNITSHLAGLLYRTTRLVGEYGLKPVFVFDGRPPELKSREISRRSEIKARYVREYREALAAGDLPRAYSKSTMTSRISHDMFGDARRLLTLLGMPWLEAPAEAEAQAAFMASRGDVWAAASKDYDTLLFGTPRLVRFLSISGREFLPSKGTSRPILPELIETGEMLSHCGLNAGQLVDLAILVGTDFNTGVKGIGPKKALKLIQQHGKIENLPEDVRSQLPREYEEIRTIYLQPSVTTEYVLDWRPPDEDGVCDFLCRERDFAPDRVRRALDRMTVPKS